MPSARPPLPRAVRPAPLLALLAVVAWLAAAACVGTGKNAPTPVQRTTVRVENRGFLDRNIFVVRSGQRIRLGTVSGNSTATLTIPAGIVATITPLAFIADPIGAPQPPVTQEITVSPGDQVVLMIPPG